MSNFSNPFVEDILRVAVVAPLDFIKGVQWEINKRSTKKIELYQLRLGDPSHNQKIDALVYFVEHGQQIPVEHLKKYADAPGLAIFEYLNPTQMMTLGQIGTWRFLPWEEGRFDRVTLNLLEVIQKRNTSKDSEGLLDQLKSWVRENSDQPSRLLWTNAPVTWKGPREINLPASGTPIVIGSLESACDFKLPLSGKGEWAVLQRTKSGLQFRSLLPQLPIQFFGDPTQLKVADRLRIFDFNFELAGNAEWTSLKNILRRFSPELLVNQNASSGPKTLADNLRELIESGASGELVVRSENRTGYFSIQEGFLDEALVGPVSGLKALFRILSWPSPQSQFDRSDKPALYSTPLRLDAIHFQKAYDRWKQRIAQLKAYWPPHQLKIAPNAEAYMTKRTWTTKDFLVFSAVCESERVYEVLNNCALLDVDVVESLISLRRDRLIQIH